MNNILDRLKSVFYIVLLLQIGPMFIKSIINQYTEIFSQKTKVGVISIKGPITSATKHVRELKKLFEDESIKAILLVVDSPGGAAGSSQAIFNEIKALKAANPTKYVVGLVENVAASGGYYIVSAADYIVATPASFIGSVGSYIAHPNVKEFIEQYKLKYDIIKSGEYKASLNPFMDLNEKHRDWYQNLSNNVYKQFISDIAIQRPKLEKDYTIWAEGKVFTGEQALALNLIDELGFESTATKALKENGNITGEIDWIKPAKSKNIFSSLLFPDDEEGELSVKNISSGIVSALRDQFLGAQTSIR